VPATPGYTITKIELTKCDNAQNKPGNPCAFVYPDTETMAPRNMGAAALVTGRNNSWPVTLHFAVWEEKAITNSVSLPSIPIAFAPGETKTVKVAIDAVSVLMKLTSVTGGKDTVPITPPSGLALTDQVVCTSRQDIGGGLVQYLCTAKPVDFY
jgi:hypothetical protein